MYIQTQTINQNQNILSILSNLNNIQESKDPEWFQLIFIKPKKTKPSIKKILNDVCDYFQLNKDQVLSKSQKSELVQVRFITMYFTRKFIKKLSLNTIGEYIGGKDHASVTYAIKTVNNLYDTDKKYKKHIHNLNLLFNRKYKI